MEQEIQITFDDNHHQPVVTSLQIAEDFGKNHRDVLRSIENLVAQNCAAKSLFYETTYESRGKQYPMYLMNRDGFSLLVMGFTGKEAMNWKLKYIQAFNDMEKKLQIKQSKQKMDSSERLRIMEMNAKTRIAQTLLKMTDVETLSKEYKNILVVKASEILTGEQILPLPKQSRKTYSATEIGKLLGGISANKVGRLANEHNLKTSEYGEMYRSKSEHSSKEVDTWRYYESVIPAMKNLI